MGSRLGTNCNHGLSLLHRVSREMLRAPARPLHISSMRARRAKITVGKGSVHRSPSSSLRVDKMALDVACGSLAVQGWSRIVRSTNFQTPLRWRDVADVSQKIWPAYVVIALRIAVRGLPPVNGAGQCPHPTSKSLEMMS